MQVLLKGCCSNESISSTNSELTVVEKPKFAKISFLNIYYNSQTFKSIAFTKKSCKKTVDRGDGGRG